nr:D-aminoacyl-tRNA deacylase [Bacteroidales bacterium]
MRAVIQRVQKASVEIDKKTKSEIKNGLLILIGIEDSDNRDDINWLCKKISQLRIFDDDKGIMNLSVMDIDGEILAISQFTLHAKTKKGNRPSYIKAAKPDVSIPLYKNFVNSLS